MILSVQPNFLGSILKISRGFNDKNILFVSHRHANLMLNLFSLMVDASVPDIALEPDKAVKKVQDKLRYAFYKTGH